MSGIAKFDPPEFASDVIVIVGGYGSGKSEVSVNLARFLALSSDRPVSLGDLDVINPYFRSREAAESLATLGVKSLVPPGAQAQADLPIIIPEIKGAIQSPVGRVIIDVGGDDAGATVLSSLADAFVPGAYEMLMTVNAYRPFTSDVEGTTKVMKAIEKSGQLRFTGLISNSHMIEQTTPKEILHGLDLVEQVSKATGYPISFVSGLTEVLAEIDAGKIPYPVLEINRSLLKPWERNSQAGTS